MIAEREGMTLDKKPVVVGGFVQSKKRTAESLGELEERAKKLREVTTAANVGGDDDEIDLDEEEEEEENQFHQPPASSTKNVTEKAIPTAVFGGLTTAGNS